MLERREQLLQGGGGGYHCVGVGVGDQKDHA